MLVTNGKVHVSLTIRGSIQGTFHQVFLHRRTSTLGIVVEQQQSLGQLSVVQSLSLQHVGCNGLVVTLSYERLDTLALILLAGSIQLVVESKLLDIVKILLLEISGRHIVVGIDKGKHILEHTTGGTRCGHKLHHLLALGLVLLPSLYIRLALSLRRRYDALADSCGSLQLQEWKTSFKLA